MAWQTPKTDWDSAGNPLPTDFNRIEGNIQYLQDNKIINADGVPSIQAGTRANRPAAGVVGRWYLATDIGVIYRDTGTLWVPLNPKAAKPGDIVLAEALTEQQVRSDITVVKKFKIFLYGKYRITGEGKILSTTDQMTIYVGINELTITSTTYTPFSIDLLNPIDPYEIIEIKARASGAISQVGYIRNIRLKYEDDDLPDALVLQN